MIHRCAKPCGNKTASGYCATTVCINPQYSNLGTAQYGQGVQKRIITNADKLRSMTDEELATWLTACLWGEARDVPFLLSCTVDKWLDWLRKEAVG